MCSCRRRVFTTSREWFRSAIGADCGLSHDREPRDMWNRVCFTAQLHMDAPKSETRKIVSRCASQKLRFS